MKNASTGSRILLLIAIVAVSLQTKAQMVSMTRSQFGIETGLTFSGNGLTGNYAHGLYRKGDKGAIGIYALTPYSLRSIDGAQLYLVHDLVGNDNSYTKVLGLHLFMNLSYVKSGKLSETSLKAMEIVAPEFTNAQSLEFETAQAFAGLGMSARLNSRLSLYGDLGVGTYKTLNSNSLTTLPEKFENYRNDKDLILGTRVGFRFRITG